MEWRQDVEDAHEFVDSMKSDVFEDRVYVFTPRGDIIDMSAGSTPIDFAYHVHTDIGHRCRGGKVNGKLVALDYKLKTGDKAPEFDVLDQNGKSVKLADFRGRKVLLYFYPKASTPGCTIQSCRVRDAKEDFSELNTAVIGVSPDAETKQKKFDKEV